MNEIHRHVAHEIVVCCLGNLWRSNLMGIAPHVGMLGITLPTLPDLDFQIRPMSKLLGDITQMPLVNQIGDLVRTR